MPPDFTYREAELIDSARYDRDHTRVKPGQRSEVFAAAKTALQKWQHFRLGCPPTLISFIDAYILIQKQFHVSKYTTVW